MEVAIPKLRREAYLPDWLLERRKRAERAMTTWWVATCYLLGVSTRCGEAGEDPRDHPALEVPGLGDVMRTRRACRLDLLDYDGATSDRVKVGTFKGATGLEFKFVLLSGLDEGPVEPWGGESDDSFRERVEQMNRELYVGMMRARDGP